MFGPVIFVALVVGASTVPPAPPPIGEVGQRFVEYSGADHVACSDEGGQVTCYGLVGKAVVAATFDGAAFVPLVNGNPDLMATGSETRATTFGDGTYLVGTDIAPGTYRADNSSGSCYWERLSGVSGEFDDIIANDNPNGQTIVEIADSDFAFTAARCGTWTPIGG